MQGRAVGRRSTVPILVLLALVAFPARAEDGTLELSLRDAVHRALDHGAAANLAKTRKLRADVARREAMGGLLPHAGVEALRYSDSLNLEVFGFAVPGQPAVIGPFNVTDLQISAAVELFNLAALRHYQAARTAADAGAFELRESEDDVVAAVARLYVLVQRAETEVASRTAEKSLFERLLAVAQDEFDAGTGTRLDVAQARVRLASVNQALIAAGAERDSARLALLDAIGETGDPDLVLTDALEQPGEIPATEELVATARANRPQLKAAAARLRAATLALSAARSSRLPSVELQAHGSEGGNHADTLYWSRRVGVVVSIPIFESGIEAAVARARLDLDDAKTLAAEVDRSVDRQVRQARTMLESAEARVDVAAEAADVADQALQIARDRRAAGYGSAVEVDRAQETYATAHEDLIAARAGAALAWYELRRATGEIADLLGSPQ